MSSKIILSQVKVYLTLNRFFDNLIVKSIDAHADSDVMMNKSAKHHCNESELASQGSFI